MDEEDRTEWDRAWSSMPNRRILDVTKGDFEKMLGGKAGDILTVTICEVPKQFADKLYIENALCPVCGESTENDSSRVVASVSPSFVNFIRGIGAAAWVHQKCLDMCPLIDEPTPIPW
jgi:hypothetical protein